MPKELPEKEKVQPDERAEGANATTPISMVGPDLSTTAAQQCQSCHWHQRNFKVGFEAGKRKGFRNFQSETLLSMKNSGVLRGGGSCHLVGEQARCLVESP